MEDFDVHHVLHSLSIAQFATFPKDSKVLDVGTGGGLPGIPLAIMFPNVEFHLVDSIGKKIQVVRAVMEELELRNVHAFHQRAEDLKGRYHYVVSRAVTRLTPFYHWISQRMVENNLPDGGLYALKGGDLEEEISEFQSAFKNRQVTAFNISSVFAESYFETKKVLHVS